MLEKGFTDIIQKIYMEKGKDIFLEPKILKSLLLDYTKNEFKRECSLLTAILDADSVNFINRAENIVDCKQFLVKRLEDDYSLSPSKSAEMLDLLFLILHGTKLEPVIVNNTVPKFSKGTTENSKIKLQLLHTFNKTMTDSIAFSPNGKIIITSDDEGLKLWDVKTGQLIHNLRNDENTVDSVFSLSFNPTGEYVISTCGKSLILWEINTGKRILRFYDDEDDYEVSINLVLFSPDGKYVISGHANGTIKLWDVCEYRKISLLHVFEGYDEDVHSISFSPNGQYFISLTFDNISLWDVKNGCLIRTYYLKHEGVCRDYGSVSFNPNGLFFVSGTNSGIKLWNIESEQPIFNTSENYVKNIGSVAFSPIGDFIISGSYDGSLILWKIENERFIIKTLETLESSVYYSEFSPDGKFIASLEYNKVKLWEIK